MGENDNNNIGFIGKKIFFLYPNAVVQNRVIAELVQQEYEVYTAKNKDSLKAVRIRLHGEAYRQAGMRDRPGTPPK